MHYSIEQLQNQRWGIYCDLTLMATIGCYQNALVILTKLQERQPKSLSKKAVQATVEKELIELLR